MVASLSSLLGGKATSGGTGGSYESVNPGMLDDVVAVIELADSSTIDLAFECAASMRDNWASCSLPDRLRVVEEFRDQVRAEKNQYAELITWETGKPLQEAHDEIAALLRMCEFYSQNTRYMESVGAFSVVAGSGFLVDRQPLGVLAVESEGMSPFFDPAWHLIPALVLGNSVVWRPSSHAGYCARRLYGLLVDAGLPPSALSLVYADASAFRAGTRRRRAHRVTTLGCHYFPDIRLGARNVLLVFPDADLLRAAQVAVTSGYAGCASPFLSTQLILVHEAVHEEFVRLCHLLLVDALVGNPLQNVMYGPLHDQESATLFERHLDQISAHHRVHGSQSVGRITHRNRRSGFLGEYRRGLFYHPVIVDGVESPDELFGRETHGPIASVVRFSGNQHVQHLLDLLNINSLVVHTADPKMVMELKGRVQATFLAVNGAPYVQGLSSVGRLGLPVGALSHAIESVIDLFSYRSYCRWENTEVG